MPRRKVNDYREHALQISRAKIPRVFLKMHVFTPAFCLFLGLLSVISPAFAQAPWFQDVAKEAGLTVPHISSLEKRYIVESMSGGVGFIDCDNDGHLDVVTVNGSNVERYRQGGDPMVTLYHQDVVKGRHPRVYRYHPVGRAYPQRMGHGGGGR